MYKKMTMLAVMAMVLGGTCSFSAAAEDVTKKLEQLQSQLQSQQQEIAELKSQLGEKASADDLKKALSANIGGEMPEWLQDVKFKADLRLRYQRNWADGEKHRSRVRYRLRAGVEKSWMDGAVTAAFGLASGDSDGATSTNETMGDYFASDDLWIDYAYLKIKCPMIKGVSLQGGKIKNPFVKTDMIWDSDITPEGGFVKYQGDFGALSPFVGAGYFILDEDSSEHDSTLAAYQGGVDVDCGPVKWTTAGCYYYYEGYENAYDDAGGNNENAGGDKLLAGNFHVLDLVSTIKTKIMDIPVAVTLDYACNLGEDDPTAGMKGLDSAYAGYAKIGKNKKQGDWSLKYKYAYIEANATPGGLNDSDFGGANRKGHAFGGTYSITDFMTIGATCIHAEDIDGANAGDDDWTGQLDVILKY